jgi:hypothetical protein
MDPSKDDDAAFETTSAAEEVAGASAHMEATEEGAADEHGESPTDAAAADADHPDHGERPELKEEDPEIEYPDHDHGESPTDADAYSDAKDHDKAPDHDHGESPTDADALDADHPVHGESPRDADADYSDTTEEAAGEEGEATLMPESEGEEGSMPGPESKEDTNEDL